MSKLRNGTRGAAGGHPHLRHDATQRPRTPSASSRTRTDTSTDGLARPEFLRRVGAAAAALGLPTLPGFEGVSAAKPTTAPPRPGRGRSRVNLFFNLSHLRNVDTAHYLYLGGKKYALTRTADKPEALRHERRTNAFLQAVPDDQITHHVKNVDISNDVISLAYVTCNENATTGTWAMTSMHFNIPPTAMAYAHAQARLLTSAGPLPLSNKRRL